MQGNYKIGGGGMATPVLGKDNSSFFLGGWYSNIFLSRRSLATIAIGHLNENDMGILGGPGHWICIDEH